MAYATVITVGSKGQRSFSPPPTAGIVAKLATEASSPYFYTPCCLGHPLHFNLHRIYPFSLSKLYTFMAPAYCAGFPLGNYDCPVRPERVI